MSEVWEVSGGIARDPTAAYFLAPLSFLSFVIITTLLFGHSLQARDSEVLIDQNRLIAKHASIFWMADYEVCFSLLDFILVSSEVF
jgi:hypothetical protein